MAEDLNQATLHRLGVRLYGCDIWVESCDPPLDLALAKVRYWFDRQMTVGYPRFCDHGPASYLFMRFQGSLKEHDDPSKMLIGIQAGKSIVKALPHRFSFRNVAVSSMHKIGDECYRLDYSDGSICGVNLASSSFVRCEMPNA